MDFKCTAGGAQPSINGQFIALTVTVAAHANFADSGWPTLEMSAHDFKAWDAGGTRVDGVVGNSSGCVQPSELLPSSIDPGTQETGLIILDVPKGSGSASFAIGGFEGSYGWEWKW
ncbi:MAG TPA: hypothetical protein VIG41_00190 [Micrococcaceae bacterium]